VTGDEPLRQSIRWLLAGESLAVLSTQHHGQPYASLVGFAASDDLRTITFATMRTTRKFCYLTANPQVALLVDNRNTDPGDFLHAMAVTATGRVAEALGRDRESLLRAYLLKLPHLEAFVRNPDCVLLKVTVQTYYAVSQFEKVMKLCP
jgi:nitroimidazol reductase NimA-like FMN-containing flavoprotein (pyridoxamine 5'-phosphate oxidase superfamily)